MKQLLILHDKYSMSDDRIKIGHAAESAVVSLLKERGCIILDRNVSDRMGEIDLIAQKGRQIFVVEVRSRRHATFDDCLDSIGGVKRGRVRSTARRWIAKNDLEFEEIRLCVVAVVWNSDKPEILFIEDAF